jgi:hypothetical protein
MSLAEARLRGIGKRAFYYLRRNSENRHSFRTYAKVLSRLAKTG